MITLSIVIVNYNVCGFLEQCLLSLADAVKEIPHEIFVVDNASTDGSDTYIPRRFPQVKYIYNAENVGFARANNQAMALSSGRYVLLLNPDTVVGESVLSEACRFLSGAGDDFQRIHAGAGGIARREKMPDVGQPRRAEDGVGDGVREHVAVGMRDGPGVGRNFRSAEHAASAAFQAVNVVADADAHRRLRIFAFHCGDNETFFRAGTQKFFRETGVDAARAFPFAFGNDDFAPAFLRASIFVLRRRRFALPFERKFFHEHACFPGRTP